MAAMPLPWIFALAALLAARESPGSACNAQIANDTPPTFTVRRLPGDYQWRDVMIPMRDGVRLHTLILIPAHTQHAAILLTRSASGAENTLAATDDRQLEVALKRDGEASDLVLADGYIRVVQDIRGKFGSEGAYVMNRPLRGSRNATSTDESTDAYDTIEWLVHHVSESDGKVAILGVSYGGFEALMATMHPHPALKAAVVMNPMVDGWMGDDWFHHGAFRQQNLKYIYEQTASRQNAYAWPASPADEYQFYLDGVTAGAIAHRYGMEQLGFWNKLVSHPAYDTFWSSQAVDKLVARKPLNVPTMLVASLWDQEDTYGAFAVYNALWPHDTQHQLFLVAGPWSHAQEVGDGDSLGPLHFGSDTARYFRNDLLRPFLAHYLKGSAYPPAPVTAFVTGTNVWETLSRWPGFHRSDLFLLPQSDESLRLANHGPDATARPGRVTYLADPSRPVPYRHRPVGPMEGPGWEPWLTGDQREAASRPDVVTFTSAALTEAIHVRGAPYVHLVASTSGTDSDWVVKLIDVYPDHVPRQPDLDGYELGISMDIFRGRYREGFTKAKPLPANTALPYDFSLPEINHVFLPGHRIMIQVQSSWFPLYDRNPQTFVPNIFLAQPTDFVPATQRVSVGAAGTYVALPVAKSL
jgi:uncharacterized protein